MLRISTPTASSDKFGPGKNGFAGHPNATELEPVWYDAVQETISRCIEGQGIALDPLDNDQLTTAINSWGFSGTPTITGTLTIEGELVVASGGTATFEAGSDANFSGDVTFNGTSSSVSFAGGGLIPTVTIGAPAGGDPALIVTGGSGDALRVVGTSTFTKDLDIGANTILGGGGTVNVSTIISSQVSLSTITFAPILGLPSSINGRVNYDDRRLSVGDGAAARRIHSPREVYVVSHNTAAAITDIPGATMQIEVENDEWIFVKVESLQLCSASGAVPQILISASNGVDNVVALNDGDPDIAVLQLPSSTTINQKRPNSFVVRWKPTNDVPVPNNTLWNIKVRHGLSGAGTLTTSNILLGAWYE